MKILYITHNVSWKGGGIFYTAYHQGRHLAERGHEVTLLSISDSGRLRFSERVVSGVRIVESPDLLWGRGRTGWDPWNILRRILYLRNANFDLVHGYESRPAVSLPALYLKHKLQVPLFYTWADWFGRGGKGTERGRGLSLIMGPLETACEDCFYPLADGLVAMGTPLLERAVSIGIPKDRDFEPPAWQ